MTALEVPHRAEDGRLWYYLSVNPVPWAIGEIGVARKKNGGGPRVYVAPNKDLKTYQNAVREEMARYHTFPVDLPVDLLFVFTRSLDAITRGSAGSRAHIADSTNMQKATEDALQGILFGNDNQNRAVAGIIRDQAPDIEPSVAIGFRITTHEKIQALIPPSVLEKIVKVS